MTKTYIIAEVAQAHDGSLGILHSYIDAISKTGVDAIKFQTHIAEAESSEFEPFRKKFSYVDKSRYDYWKRMEFTIEEWRQIKQHCDAVGIEFLSSPFSNAAVDLLEEIGVAKYKVGSGEITNSLMIDKIVNTGKEIILSSGMSSYQELDKVFADLKAHTSRISILQCTTKYPTEGPDIGLNVLSELKQRYDVTVGLSDHSGRISPSIAAVAMGAKIIEVHAVFDKQMFGPDSSSSLTIDELKKMVSEIRFIEAGISSPINKYNNNEFKELKSIFEKSLAVNKNLEKGSTIEFDDLEAKKPLGKGLPASDYRSVLGKKLTKGLNKWDFLTVDHINE